MAYSFELKNIFRNPALGLVPLFVFSILVFLMASRFAVIIALLLSLLGVLFVNKHSKILFDVSLITFIVSLILSFTTLSGLPALNKFIVVEIIFVLFVIIARLSKNRLMTKVAKQKDRIIKNYLKQSFRIAFQVQYGLTFHLLLLFLYYATYNSNEFFVGTTFMIAICQVIILSITVLETTRLQILSKKLFKEEWLPVVNESGEVRGRIAKSVTKDLKNQFMHPVVRVALIHRGSIYLDERDQTRLLNPGKLDYPFEKYMEFNEDLDATVKEIVRKESGNNELPLRFLLKYTFENDVTKRLIFLYVSEIDDDEQFNNISLQRGRLWNISQIEDNIGNNIFSECFELEFEYLKNTVFLAYQYKKTL